MKRAEALGMATQVTMKSIEGAKPMQIVWHLNTPMPEATYAFASQYKAIG